MHNFIKHILFLCFILICCRCTNERKPENTKSQWIAEAPAGDEYCAIDTEGKTIIPNGRIILPYGRTFRIAPHPYGLTLSKDGSLAITANSGTGPFSITLLKNPFTEDIQIQQIPEGAQTDNDLLAAVFMGVAISPDNKTVYVAGGQENKVFIFDIESGNSKGEINCAIKTREQDFSEGYLGEMALSKDGKRLYVLDQIGFSMLIIDTESQKILHHVPTGRYPFGITLSPNEQKAYIANVGMFEYSIINNANAENRQEKAIEYPAFAYDTEKAKEGIKNDSINIPGLGNPNVPESFSVWEVDLTKEKPTISSKIKTGILVGEEIEGIPAVGGSSPNSLVATEKYVFVSNGNNDCISVIDIEADSVLKEIYLTPDERLGHLRGIIPFGITISPDQKTLYVAESGLNAVAVIDVNTLAVKGHIPVGWFPSKLAVSTDGKKLIVANAKGYGSGPNGGANFELGPEGSNIGRLMKGSVTILDIPNNNELAALSEQVVTNNFTFKEVKSTSSDNPIPIYSKATESPIKHIVFISKENRTYDEVFGQLEGGKGEPSLARYGISASFTNKVGDSTVKDAIVMVNHLQLAKRFAISDNFYVDADHSADGHRWLVNTYPNEWVETSVSAAYGGKRRMRANSSAPGNLALVGSSGAIYPEDYNEHGSIWDHFERNNIDFFNFGFGLEMAGGYSDSTLKYTGVLYNINYPLPTPLYSKSSKKYATYNMAIPDQFRADMFIEEFEERWMNGNGTMPQVLTVILPNDHGAGDRPAAGYPFRESYMMDNDLALGRIVEYLSHTPYWKNMAIIVTEDDSQDGVDHIDAHRSLLIAISPYAKKNYISHTHFSFGSIFKTFWHILGLPYLNQYDAGATSMADMFSFENPDFTPYNAYPVDIRAFDPQKALDPFDENFDWKAVLASPEIDNPEDLIKASEERDQQTILERERQSNPRLQEN